MDESKQGGGLPFDLSELTDFQFGPAWARKGAEASAPLPFSAPAGRERRSGSRREGGREPFNRERGERRERRPEQAGPRPPREDRAPRPGARDRRPAKGEKRPERPQRELPQPAEGFRVELRPANIILEVFSKEIQKLKRALPLLDLARVVMANKERYDLVFMKMEGAPMLIHSTRGDGACWLTEAEAVAHLWRAPWLGEFYATEQVETEAPKGSFNGVAKVDEHIIGPANWHGYQAALMNLYRSHYANMPLETFKRIISIDKSEEAIAAWVAAASHKTVWKPVYEGAAEAVFEDTRAVEADFLANAYGKAYEVVDKVFINGATPRAAMSPGIAAHVSILADKTRRFPQMLIPNLCHGLARHHMPIYKWQGNHFTGPSRVRAIPADTVLADRMTAIVAWAKEHSGKKLDSMFAELSGVPTGTDEESAAKAAEAHAPYVADLVWLLEQGFLVVTNDNAIWYPKGEASPAPTKVESPQRRKGQPKRGERKPQKPAKAEPKKEDAATEATGAPAPAEEPSPGPQAV